MQKMKKYIFNTVPGSIQYKGSRDGFLSSQFSNQCIGRRRYHGSHGLNWTLGLDRLHHQSSSRTFLLLYVSLVLAADDFPPLFDNKRLPLHVCFHYIVTSLVSLFHLSPSVLVVRSQELYRFSLRGCSASLSSTRSNREAELISEMLFGWSLQNGGLLWHQTTESVHPNNQIKIDLPLWESSHAKIVVFVHKTLKNVM